MPAEDDTGGEEPICRNTFAHTKPTTQKADAMHPQVTNPPEAMRLRRVEHQTSTSHVDRNPDAVSKGSDIRPAANRQGLFMAAPMGHLGFPLVVVGKGSPRNP